VSEIRRINAGSRMSQAVSHGATVYLAGQVADDRSQGTERQTAEVLAKIDSLLGAAGTDKSRILTTTIWLADIGDFDAMNAVWDAWVSRENPPARACVQSALARPEIKVEIQVVAAI
jgi:enamine deaminase RidA (YjgF/YER057c/UK114 family)